MITKKTENGVTTYEVQDAKGNPVELSSEVFRDIFLYQRREYHREDIVSKLEEEDNRFSEADIENATTLYEKYLERDDSWNYAADGAIKEISAGIFEP